MDVTGMGTDGMGRVLTRTGGGWVQTSAVYSAGLLSGRCVNGRNALISSHEAHLSDVTQLCKRQMRLLIGVKTGATVS